MQRSDIPTHRRANMTTATPSSTAPAQIETRATLSLDGSCAEQAFDPSEIRIGTAAELSERMLAASKGYAFDGSASGEMLGLISIADDGAVGKTAGHAANVVFVVSTVEAARRALEPQHITSFEVNRADTRWIEDRDPADPIFWSSATVRAEGESFNLGNAILNSLVTAVGMVPGPVGAAVGTASVLGAPAIGGAINKVTKGSCVRIKAPKYGPISVTDELWTEAKINGSTVVMDSHNKYHGVDIGTSELRIDLRATKFAEPAGSFYKTFPVAVQPIVVSTLGSKHVEHVGEEVTFSGIANNATTETDHLSAAVVSAGSILSQQKDGTYYKVQFKTPDKRDQFPAKVEFTWQGRTLPAGAIRSSTAEAVVGGDITIAPRDACLTPGDSVGISAELTGFDGSDKSITWTASAGQISGASGLTATYTAPSQIGKVQINVKANADDKVTDKVEYTVSKNCIKKAWSGGGEFSLEGTGTYGAGSASPGCPADNHDGDQERELNAALSTSSPSVIPPINELWFTRSESINSTFSHSATHYYYDGKGGCKSLSLQGHNNSQFELSSSDNGTLSLSFNTDLAGQCENNPTDSNEVECVDPQVARGHASGFYYLESTADASYRLSGQLSCSGLAGNVQNMPVAISVQRYVGAARTPATTIKDMGVRGPDGNLTSFLLVNLDSCHSPNQTQPFDVSFSLDGPNPGDANDLIVIQAIEVGVSNAAADGLGGLGAPVIDYPPSASLPTPGSYNTAADYDFSMRLQTR